MTPKFALYCNVANVVLISIWTSDNLFRQEYLICMQGGRRHVLWLPPFTSSANAVSQRWREYFFAKDNVQILKQMEDLLNSQLDILMYFIIISLLDGNMFFKSDKETCLHLSGWFNSTACLQTPRLSHSFQGAHQYTGTVEENLFFPPDPTWRDPSQAELGKCLACASALPHAKGPVKEVAPDGNMVEGIFYFFFFLFSPCSPQSSPLLPKQLTLARKRVSGFRGALHLHIIKTNVITFVRGEAPSHSGEESEGGEK